jgi:hypothetical protein
MAKSTNALQSRKTPSKQTVHTRTQESLEAVIGQIEGSAPVISDKHITKYFALKSEMIKAIRSDHEDLKDLTKNSRKFNLFYLIAGGIIILIVVLLLGIFNKEYLGRFFELLFAFLGGVGVGGAYVAGKKEALTRISMSKKLFQKLSA